MLFNSISFLLFLSLFFLVWRITKRNDTSRWLTIVSFSMFFYGWWDWRFLFLIIGSGLIDYFAALYIEKKPQLRKSLLVLSLLGNLLSLSVFKYSQFFASCLEKFFLNFGLSLNLNQALPEFVLILPVGISFYTFQSMSYTIDVYRGQLKPTKNILHFFSYLMMFPQLVAGPIVRAKSLLPQLKQIPNISESETWEGTKLVISGYFRKVVIADGVAPFVNRAFSNPVSDNSFMFWWLVTIAFAIQIYFDFSGYSKIARGIAKWMGYEFALNFDHPYISSSLREFWSRWHISLSTWFRDYVYIPLGGSRESAIKTSFNLWVTMLASGLWHGAAWTFIAWGGLHAFFLSFEKITKWPELLMKIPFFGKIAATSFTLFQVLIAWVFFRAQSFEQAFQILEQMFSFKGGMNFFFSNHLRAIFVIAAVWEGAFFFGLLFNLNKRINLKFWELPLMVVLIILTIFFRGPGGEFIYFQF